MDLALSILDGTTLRPGVGPVMSVTRAKFEQKGTPFSFFGSYSSSGSLVFGWFGSSFASPIVSSFRRSSLGHFVTSKINKYTY